MSDDSEGSSLYSSEEDEEGSSVVSESEDDGSHDDEDQEDRRKARRGVVEEEEEEEEEGNEDGSSYYSGSGSDDERASEYSSQGEEGSQYSSRGEEGSQYSSQEETGGESSNGSEEGENTNDDDIISDSDEEDRSSDDEESRSIHEEGSNGGDDATGTSRDNEEDSDTADEATNVSRDSEKGNFSEDEPTAGSRPGAADDVISGSDEDRSEGDSDADEIISESPGEEDSYSEDDAAADFHSEKESHSGDEKTGDSQEQAIVKDDPQSAEIEVEEQLESQAESVVEISNSEEEEEEEPSLTSHSRSDHSDEESAAEQSSNPDMEDDNEESSQESAEEAIHEDEEMLDAASECSDKSSEGQSDDDDDNSRYSGYSKKDGSDSDGSHFDSEEEGEQDSTKPDVATRTTSADDNAPQGKDDGSSKDETTAAVSSAEENSLKGDNNSNIDNSNSDESTEELKKEINAATKGEPDDSESGEESESEEESGTNDEESEEESSDESTKQKSETEAENGKSDEESEGGSSDESTKKKIETKAENGKNKQQVVSDDDDSSSGVGVSDRGEPTTRRFARKLTGNVMDYYSIQDLITKEQHASVYSARNKDTGKIRAAKEMKKGPENDAYNALVLNEFEILKELNHKGLVNLDGALFENERYYFLVTDLYKGGDLREELMNTGLYSEERAAELIKQVLDCLSYVHGEGIVHRDIKPGNILTQDVEQIRVTGFGIAAHCADKERLSEMVGTANYMAPEVLSMSYGPKADVWSCGVLLFLVLSGHQPFKGATNEDTFNNIVEANYTFSDPAWDAISNDAKDFTQKLLTWDEKARPTAVEALKHPWIVSGGTSRTIKSPAKSSTTLDSKTEEKDQQVLDPLTRLKFAACSFVATKLLPKGEAAKAKEEFCAVTKLDGRLSVDEATSAFCKVLGIDLNREQLNETLKNVDADGSKGVMFSEFIYSVLDMKGLLGKAELLRAFELFGKDTSDLISKQDLKTLLKLDLALEKTTVKSIVAEFEDGEEISLEKFLTLAGFPATIVKRIATREQSSDEKKLASKSESGSEDPEEMGISISDKFELDDHSDMDDMATADSHSVKISASSFVSHRLGALTEHYEIIDFIAKGSYGVVCSAIHKETDTIRAVKELKKSKKNKEKNELMLKEFHILKELDHPNIIRMHELFEDKRHYYIVTGVSKGGDLHRELKKRGQFEERDAAVLLKQILVCVNYCHKNNVIHRDLKPGNILLEEDKRMENLKVIDFGEAIVAPPTEKLTEITGTMAYMAPDVLGQNYGHKCDIWSCGVIAFLLLTGKQPLKGASDEETFHNIVKGNISYDDPIWEALSENALDFVKTLLTWDQHVRPTAAEALRHPWVIKKANRTMSVDDRKHTVNALTNLEKFDAKSKLRVATCAFIASQLMGKEEKEKIDDVYRAIDTNNDGTLNRDEVKYGYEKFFERGLTDDEIDAIFKHVDADGNGELGYSQFLFGAMDKKDLLSSKNLKKAFGIFDQDGSGDISLDELAQMLSLTENEKDLKALNKYISQVDKDGDGKISYEEFAQMALGNSLSSFAVEEQPADDSPKSFEETECSIEEDKEKGEALTHEPLDIIEPPEAAEQPETTVSSKDSRLRQLQKSIDRANNKHLEDFRSNRDPPQIRIGRADPPSFSAVPVKTVPSTNDTSSVADESTIASSWTAPKETLTAPDLLIAAQPLAARDTLNAASTVGPVSSRSVHKPTITLKSGCHRISSRSPRSAKIDEACQGFDRIQEKIASLRMLLSTTETPANFGEQHSDEAPQRLTRSHRAPNVETLDSAFAKLKEIQSKMRALQALAKANAKRKSTPS